MPKTKDEQIKQAIFLLTKSITEQEKHLKEIANNLKSYQEAVKTLGLILKELNAK